MLQEGERPLQVAHHDGHHRADAQCLLHGRLQPGVAASVDVVGQRVQRGRLVEQQVEGPGQGCRGGLMPGDQQDVHVRQQLLAAKSVALFITRVD